MSQSTNNYAIFKTIKGNRNLRRYHVDKLAAAIKRKNLLPYIPILTNEDLEVIDGQHRLAAAQFLKYDVYYEIVDGLTLDDVMDINVNSQSWSINDFIDTWITLGKMDYLKLRTFTDAFKMSVTVGAALLYGVIPSSVTSSSRKISDIIRSGEFKVKTPELAHVIARNLVELNFSANHDLRKDREFISAFTMLMRNPDFDYDKFVAKLNLHHLKIENRPSTKYYLVQIEEIYNFSAKITTELFKSTYEVNNTKPR